MNDRTDRLNPLRSAANRIATTVALALPALLTASTALAGGGGGAGGSGTGSVMGAPEPTFWAMCAIVAGSEAGRRYLKNRK